MSIGSIGYEYLKKRESLELVAYLDRKKGVWTIGYGATFYENGVRVKQGDKINLARAVQLLNYHIGLAAATINRYVTAPLNQNQFDALTSFTYNVGGPAFQTSTLRKVVNANPNNFAAIQAQFNRWIYDDGSVLNGLVTRRKEEFEIYANGTVTSSNSIFFLILIVIGIFLYRKRKKRKS